jgi:hypothetical protein
MSRGIFVIIVLLLLIESIKVASVEAVPLPTSLPTPVEMFMARIAELESGAASYSAINQYGMLGRYQFDPNTIKFLGFNVTDEEFLNNPSLQDSVMVTYMKFNYNELKSLIEEYEGTTRNGVVLHNATILAGAHFAGPGGIKKYILSTSGEGRVDGNGMTVKRYIKNFNDFNLPLLESD